MGVISLAHTTPVNPLASSPTLTIPDLWAGLLEKCRHPQASIAPIADCEVLSETPTEIRRIITVTPGMGMDPAGRIEEKIVLAAPNKATFVTKSGTVIENIISRGGSGDETELYLTFTFEWQHPDVQRGSVEEKERMEGYEKIAKGAVERSLDVIRGLKAGGRLGVV